MTFTSTPRFALPELKGARSALAANVAPGGGNADELVVGVGTDVLVVAFRHTDNNSCTAADNQHLDYSHRPYGPPFGADVETGEPVIGGDVVGCGLDFDCCSIFFTVNGTELPTAFVDVDVTREWFPSFSLLLPGDEAEVVSGHPSAPFSWRWDAEAILGLKWHVACATELKETGNQNFRGGNFKTAVGFYTLGLAHPELNELAGAVEVVLLSNRAEAYLKLEGWQLAIADCKAALTLDPTHGKSQRRLASAQTFALLAEERK